MGVSAGTVLWSDEAKEELFDPISLFIWRKSNEANKLKITLLAIKHGGGTIMVWFGYLMAYQPL